MDIPTIQLPFTIPVNNAVRFIVLEQVIQGLVYSLQQIPKYVKLLFIIYNIIRMYSTNCFHQLFDVNFYEVSYSNLFWYFIPSSIFF